MNILTILSLLVQIAQLILSHITTSENPEATAQALQAHVAAFVPPKKS